MPVVVSVNLYLLNPEKRKFMPNQFTLSEINFRGKKSPSIHTAEYMGPVWTGDQQLPHSQS
jgi:hypothetical protein